MLRFPKEMAVSLSLVCFVGHALGGCATYRDSLERGQTAYDKSEHAQALAIFRSLERDLPRMSTSQQTRYLYFRGMTDYRLGYHLDARHWLALAQASDQEHPGALHEAWRERLTQSLADLNQEVYRAGVEALSNNRRPADVSQ